MTSKRKSVTFSEHASTSYPKSLDGSSSPNLITTAPATQQPSLELDPMYLTWLRSATKAQYPFIVNGTFAKHVYCQNFDEHFNMKHDWHFQRAQEREAAVPALAEKYGSLGWGNLYQKVTKDAWVKNYREIYRFDGTDEQLLEKIAEAYDEIKRTIAEEEKANVQSTQYKSVYSHVSGIQWEAFTQGGGALASPDFGPDGVHLAFDDAADGPVDGEEFALFGTKGEEGNGNEISFDSGVGGREFRRWCDARACSGAVSGLMLASQGVAICMDDHWMMNDIATVCLRCKRGVEWLLEHACQIAKEIEPWARANSNVLS